MPGNPLGHLLEYFRMASGKLLRIGHNYDGEITARSIDVLTIFCTLLLFNEYK